MKSDGLRVQGGSAGAVLLCALSLSIGWGVRGNWGHEYGAMIPGALAALAAVICSGRDDWRRRAAYFAFFGTLGWSFGGSISYMIVIGYTHSGHLPSVIYGFACLFLIGFLWGALGGTGTALPVFLTEERLRGLFPPILAVFAAWILEDVAFTRFPGLEGALDWFDTDWPAALLAILAVLILALVRRRLCEGCSLVLNAALGWWAGFLVLVVLLGLRMTPPRSDNWAGILGMTGGVYVFLARRGLRPVLFASILAGLFAGLGFSGATLLKLVIITSGLDANYHSILEQTFGFVSGIGIAVTMALIARRAPRLASPTLPGRSDWTVSFSLLFTLAGITYLNIRKNVASVWLPNHAIPESIYGVAAHWWFDAAYLFLSVVVIAAVIRHRRQPLALLPASPLGRAQLLYLLFLWWIVIGNLSRYLPFQPGRLVTEGVIHVNACIASLLALLVPREHGGAAEYTPCDWTRLARRTALIGALATVAVVGAETAITRAVHGDKWTGGQHANLHIRFGPEATHLTKP